MKKRKNKAAIKSASVLLMSVVLAVYFVVGVYSVKGNDGVTQGETPVETVGGNDGYIKWSITGDTLTFTKLNDDKTVMNDYTTDTAPWLTNDKIENVKQVVFDNTITKLGAGTLKFNKRPELNKVTIGQNVSMVSTGFCQNANIGEVVVKGENTSINERAFEDCHVDTFDLTNVTKEKGIHDYAIVSNYNSNTKIITIGTVKGELKKGEVQSEAARYVESINALVTSSKCVIENNKTSLTLTSPTTGSTGGSQQETGSTGGSQQDTGSTGGSQQDTGSTGEGGNQEQTGSTGEGGNQEQTGSTGEGGSQQETGSQTPVVDDSGVDGKIRWTIVGDTLTFTSNEGLGYILNDHTSDTAPWLLSGRIAQVHNVVFDNLITGVGAGTLNNLTSIDKVTLGTGVTEVPANFCYNVDIGEVVVKAQKVTIYEHAFKECKIDILNLEDMNGFIDTYAVASHVNGKRTIPVGKIVGKSDSVAEQYVKKINEEARKGQCSIGNKDGFVKYDSTDASVIVTLKYTNLPAYDQADHYCRNGSGDIVESRMEFERAKGWDKYQNGTFHAMDITGITGVNSATVYLPVPNDWQSKIHDVEVITIGTESKAIEHVQSVVEEKDGILYLKATLTHFSPYGIYLNISPNGNGEVVTNPVSSDSDDSDDDDDDDDDDEDDDDADTTVIPNGGGNGPINGIVGNNGAAAAVAGANAGNAAVNAGAVNAGAVGNAGAAVAVQQQAANNVAGNVAAGAATVNTNGLDDTPKTGKFPVLLFLAMVLALMGTGMMLITKPVSKTGFKK